MLNTIVIQYLFFKCLWHWILKIEQPKFWQQVYGMAPPILMGHHYSVRCVDKQCCWPDPYISNPKLLPLVRGPILCRHRSHWLSGTRTGHLKAIEISLTTTTLNSFRTWKWVCNLFLPCPCSGTVWKVLHKTIQLFSQCPSPGPSISLRESKCEYTTNSVIHRAANRAVPNFAGYNSCGTEKSLKPWMGDQSLDSIPDGSRQSSGFVNRAVNPTTAYTSTIPNEMDKHLPPHHTLEPHYP